ncbi:DUF2339 domain-containing protein [Qingshengfaniella alkalisoli]|uniref:DUF2339 domain-containing protein n=1 Tax=Qingshengfaniella alkalisoli TaxID=2599296 RepID=A0A5B8J7H4_9RHOB|nr:DUF2339 domain-containing protein [Qingshengfaniella alkalisoli]QDY70427.1 DUF2339 domain-containing protein [Qingshengfaniella alkalisoli]
MAGFAFLLSCFLLIGSGLGIITFTRARRVERRLREMEAQLQQLIDGGDLLADGASAASREASTTSAFDGSQPEQAHGRDAPERSVAPLSKSSQGTKQKKPARSTPERKPLSAHTTPARVSLEERFGTRWVVWAGGLALVLGGVFLVRYSIEAGLLTPPARVLAGVLLGLALLAGGEWLRRKYPDAPDRPRAYIPGVLTFAGTTTVFASIFAAHVLYGLIGSVAAFLLLACVALLTLAAAILHGPAIASYGLIASYVVPFLVQSDQASAWPLALYGIAVTCAAYTVARLRLWRWLAFAGATGALLWGHLIALAAIDTGMAGALAAYDLVVFALAAFVFVISFSPRNAAQVPGRQDRAAALILFLHAGPLLYLLQIDHFSALSVIMVATVAIALLLIATEWPVVAVAAPGAGVLLILGFLSWDVPLSTIDLQQYPVAASRIAAALADPDADGFVQVGLLFAFLSGGLSAWGAWRSAGRWALAATGVGTPLALIGIGYFRLSPFEVNLMFSGIALALAAAFLCITTVLDRNLRPAIFGRDAAVTAYATGTVGAIAAAMAMALQDGWLPVALALLAAGAVWVHCQRPLPKLPMVAFGVALLSCAAIAHQPTIVGPDRLGTTPIMNALLYGYGVPALAFSFAAWRLARHARDRVQQLFEALALFLCLTTLAVLVHHAMNDGAMHTAPETLAEWSLHSLVMLVGGIAAGRLDRVAHSSVLRHGSLGLSLAGFATIAGLHLFVLNPLVSGESIGEGAVLNLLLVAYLLPALLCAAIALWAGRHRPGWYRLVAGGLSGALAFAWVSLEVRAVFHRPYLDAGGSGPLELYSYSVAWLALGILLLLLGFRLRLRLLRLVSAAFVLAAVAKVFLVDMSGLDGVWRALSFIGLGVALIGIGLLYQRVLTKPGAEPFQSVR